MLEKLKKSELLLPSILNFFQTPLTNVRYGINGNVDRFHVNGIQVDNYRDYSGDLNAVEIEHEYYERASVVSSDGTCIITRFSRQVINGIPYRVMERIFWYPDGHITRVTEDKEIDSKDIGDQVKNLITYIKEGKHLESLIQQ